MSTEHDYLASTSQVVSAFIGNNSVHLQDMAALIASVHATLAGLGEPVPVEEPTPELKPAVPVRKSITDEYLICLDNGKRFKSLKRHLSSLGMTPAQYRAKWGLPHDYPMVAPAYAAKRSEFAKAVGLGAMRRRGARDGELASHTAFSPTAEAPPTLVPADDAALAQSAERASPDTDLTTPDTPSAAKPGKPRGRPRKAQAATAV